MRAGKIAGQGGREHLAKGDGRGDAQPAGQGAFLGMGLRIQLFDRCQYAARGGQVTLACRRQRQGARGAVEQGHALLPLQRRDIFADQLVRDPQPLARAGERAGLDHGDKGPDAVDSVHIDPCIGDNVSMNMVIFATIAKCYLFPSI